MTRVPAEGGIGVRPIRAPERSLRVARASSIVGLLVALAVVTALALPVMPEWTRHLGLGIGACAVAFTLVETLAVLPVAIRRFSLLLLDDELIIRRGALIRRVDRIPIAKVTTIRTRTGPLLRRHDLVHCTIVTTASEVTLPAIGVSDARFLMGGGSS